MRATLSLFGLMASPATVPNMVPLAEAWPGRPAATLRYAARAADRLLTGAANSGSNSTEIL